MGRDRSSLSTTYEAINKTAPGASGFYLPALDLVCSTSPSEALWEPAPVLVLRETRNAHQKHRLEPLSKILNHKHCSPYKIVGSSIKQCLISILTRNLKLNDAGGATEIVHNSGENI